MIVAIDCNCLVRWSKPDSHQDDAARLDFLLTTVAKANGKIVIPMPAFAEYLTGTNEATAGWVSGLDRKKSVQLAPFDRRSAFACATMDRAAIGSGDKKGGRNDSWQLIKIDRQIIAIASVNNAELLVSDDGGLVSTALIAGMQAKKISELPLPDSAKQNSLKL